MADQPFGKPWDELTKKEKYRRVGIGIGKGIGVLALLYFFVCSLDFLSLGFRLVGGRATGKIFKMSKILRNPIAGVMIGIISTILVQSSSTSTSIAVSTVGSGFLEVQHAIPVIMGANIGTTITSTISALAQVGDKEQFRKAFSGATIHDMFNYLTVVTLLILEMTTGYLYELTHAIMASVPNHTSGGNNVELLGAITKPLVNTIVQLDSRVLKCWANPDCSSHDNSTILKIYCDAPETSNSSATAKRVKCPSLFAAFGTGDTTSGLMIILFSILVLCGCLILLVKILKSVLKGRIAPFIKNTLNEDIPHVPWLTGYVAILIGAVMTFLVQSSSAFTSSLTPLVGLGILSLERVYPLTLGSNIGTTTTALLAALTSEPEVFRDSMQIALCHLFFNITGILIFYPLPFMRFPIPMAKFLGDTTAKYRWFAIVYMITMFVIIPLIILGLTFAGSAYVIAFVVLVFILIAFVIIVDLMQSKRPEFLPRKLRDWYWLPKPLRSLEPYDKFMLSLPCCKHFRAHLGDDVEKAVDENVDDVRGQGDELSNNSSTDSHLEIGRSLSKMTVNEEENNGLRESEDLAAVEPPFQENSEEFI